MTLNVRRVVTGHDANGRAVVLSDEPARGAISRRPGHSSCVIWSTDTVPVDNSGQVSEMPPRPATTRRGGTALRISELQPGVASYAHRTNSLDYVVILSGEIDVVLDDGEVHLEAGDVLVQRGTIHDWVNRGTAPCVMAAVLVDAEPVTIDGRPLPATG